MIVLPLPPEGWNERYITKPGSVYLSNSTLLPTRQHKTNRGQACSLLWFSTQEAETDPILKPPPPKLWDSFSFLVCFLTHVQATFKIITVAGWLMTPKRFLYPNPHNLSMGLMQSKDLADVIHLEEEVILVHLKSYLFLFYIFYVYEYTVRVFTAEEGARSHHRFWREDTGSQGSHADF